MLIRFQEQPTDDSLSISLITLLDVIGLPGQREFVYSATVEFNGQQAIERSSLTLKLTADLSRAEKRRDKPNFSARSFGQQTAVAESSVRQATTSRQASSLTEVTTEVTPSIPNSSVSGFSARTQSAASTSARSTTASVERASRSSSSELSGVTRTVTIEPESAVSPRTDVTRSESVTKTESLARAASAQFSSARSSAGLSLEAQQEALQKARANPSAESVRSASTSMVSDLGYDPASISDMTRVVTTGQRIGSVLGEMAFTPAISAPQIPRVSVTTTTLQFKKKFTITEESLGTASTFYLTAELMDSDEVVTARSETSVNHAKFLNKAISPASPPSLSAAFLRMGEISIGLEQTDMQAARVRLQRRLGPSPTCKRDKGSAWETVFEESLDMNDGELRYIDRVTSLVSSIMYRAVAVGSNDKPTEEFASAVVMIPKSELKKALKNSAARGKELNSTIKLNPLATSLKISVTDLPESTISVSVRKYDLSSTDRLSAKRGDSRGFEYVGDTPDAVNKLVDSKTRRASFKDSDLKPGGRYSYVPVAFTRTRGIVVGSQSEVEIPVDAGDSTQVSTTISSLSTEVASSDGTELQNKTVSFTIEGSLTDFGFEQIAAAIGNSATAGLFGGDIQQNRDRFNDLIQFEVVRQNETTGEVESFGMHPAGSFSDTKDTRSGLNVKSLEAETTYTYRVTACVRSAETLFPDLVSSEIDSTTLQRYTKSVSKFRGPLQLRKSTLASTARQSDSSIASSVESSDPFLAGKTADEQSIEVSIPKISATVSGVKATSNEPSAIKNSLTNEYSNSISWSVGGDVSQIDHFQVYAHSDGGSMLLGTVHADATSPYFEYTHKFKSVLSSEVYYSVVPIDLNFESMGSAVSDTLSPQLDSIVSSKTSSTIESVASSIARNSSITSLSEPMSLSGLTLSSGTDNDSVSSIRQRIKSRT